ncbi:MAG: hypothetical protein Kow0060_09750 [Methylohalobius crimeensis]
MLLEQDLIPFQVSPLPPGPWLVFAPHPDDETFGMGGALLLARENRIPVTVVVLTDGRLGGGDDVALVEAREREARAAAERLGIQTIDFWREPDRDLRPTPALVAKVGELLKQAAPATVFFPSPMEYHPDHRATARSVWEAAGRAGFQGKLWAYEISTEGRVDRLIDITAVAEKKRDLMAVYRSQLAENDYPDKIMGLNRARTYSLPAQVRYAEGFYDFTPHRGRPFAEAVYETLTPYWRGPTIESVPTEEAAAAEPEVQPPSPVWEADKAPLVSLIVRTKDRPRLLGEALESLAAQTYPNLEVIVVNDGGEDVEDIVQAYRPRFAALHYLDLQPGRGRSAAGNAGLEKASGEYLGFLDDDDWLLPEHVSLLVTVLQDCPERAVYGGIQCVRYQNGEWKSCYVYNESYDPLKLQSKNFLPIHAVLFKRSLVVEGCRMDERFDRYEDWDFWLQMAEKTRFYHVNWITGCYRIGAGGGFGFESNEADQQEGQKALYEKWRHRWSPEVLLQLVQYAREGIERPFSEAHLHNLKQVVEEKDRALSFQQAHVNNLERLVEQRDHALSSQQTHVANLEQLVNGQTEHIANLENQLEATRTHIHNLETSHQAQLEALHQDAHHWRTAYQMVIASTSWRVSAPVRGLGRAWQRIGRWVRRRTYYPRLRPAHQLEALAEGGFRALGSDPHFMLEFSKGGCPSRWVLLQVRLIGDKVSQPEIYFETGEGFSERQKFSLRPAGQGYFSALVRLPDEVRVLRLDPLQEASKLQSVDLVITEIGSLEAAVRLLGPRMLQLTRNPNLWRSRAAWLLRTLRQHGWRGTKQLIAGAAMQQERKSDYQAWFNRYGRLSETDREHIREHLKHLGHRPRISVLMPVYNPEEKWLRAAIDSVLAQLYPDWELCIADDASTAPHVRKVLEESRNRDSRIKVIYRGENGHIVAASNSALALASGEFVALMDHDDELAEHALYMVAVTANRHPDVGLIYSDEDKIDEQGRHFDPYFKPDWNPLLLFGQNYFNHLTAYRMDLMRRAGGFRLGLEGSQDWDLALRVSDLIQPKQIRHVPYVLYHWRAVSGSTARAPEEKDYASRAAIQAVSEHVERCGRKAKLEILPGGHCRIRFLLQDKPPAVSLIIPTRDGYNLLHQCVETLVQKTDYPDYEVIIVDNRSQDAQTLAYLEKLACRPQFTVLHYDAPFNFSAINNFAARHAQGEVLGFLNNDLEVLTPDWLYEMVSHAINPETGAVGAMLYYPDNHIQHAGVILGIGGVAGHAYQGFPRGYSGQMGRARLAQNLSAITAACLLVRRGVFEEVGGFDEKDLAVAFNDVDLCLKIQSHGYRNVWTPVAELNHHESATRGYEDTPEKQARFKREIQVMKQRWGALLHRDPVYNPNLSLSHCDFSIADAPRLQKPWFEFAAPIRESAA